MMGSPSKQITVILETLEGKFQLSGQGVVYPYTEFWYELDRDRPPENGKFFLKIVDPPQ
jgi:hypothetical protein